MFVFVKLIFKFCRNHDELKHLALKKESNWTRTKKKKKLKTDKLLMWSIKRNYIFSIFCINFSDKVKTVFCFPQKYLFTTAETLILIKVKQKYLIGQKIKHRLLIVQIESFWVSG